MRFRMLNTGRRQLERRGIKNLEGTRNLELAKSSLANHYWEGCGLCRSKEKHQAPCVVAYFVAAKQELKRFLRETESAL
jgi:hypothetical protein